ncbi:hypothetical protein BBP40_011042 [Aspergillus hancockii]|nr:hypothetical protein BBP40_011042 [Aspergillus hancockii]
MKIALLEQSPVDPSRYIPPVRHHFETRYISKSTAETEIDEICRDGYDMFLNYMVAGPDGGASVAAITRYLESKEIPILNATKSVVTAEESHIYQMQTKTDGMNPEQMTGKRWVCLAMEMGLESMAFTPAQWISSCLDREALHAAPAEFTFVTEAPLKSTLQSIALDVLRASGLGFVRVDISLKAESDGVSVEGVTGTPLLFSRKNVTTYEDVAIEEEFPGGHMAFFDMLVASKQIRSGRDHGRNQHLAGVYDGYASRYHAARANTGLSRMQEHMSREHDFSGTVLDLACGNGEFGAILHDSGVSATISGIDISEGMTRSSYIQDHYEKPLLIGPMDELIMASVLETEARSPLSVNDFDHVVCFAAFQFLDPVHLTACLARMFMVARKSVTAIHEDLSEAYIENMKQRNGALCTNFNHVSTLENFGVPKGWKQVLQERLPLYDNPALGETVFGFAIRFERG